MDRKFYGLADRLPWIYVYTTLAVVIGGQVATSVAVYLENQLLKRKLQEVISIDDLRLV